MPPPGRPLNVRIVGRNLPGRRFGDHDDVHVGVQRWSEVVDLVPGDAPEAVFEFVVECRLDAAGGVDFRGPHVKGRPGERFVYLSWGQGAGGAGEGFEMFRRAKLHLSVIDANVVAEALERGQVLEGTLGLTDGRGGPRCAAVRPPGITWTAARA